jgi:hypothetical protein
MPCRLHQILAGQIQNINSIIKDSLCLLTSLSDKTSFSTHLGAIKVYPAISEPWNPAEYMPVHNGVNNLFAAERFPWQNRKQGASKGEDRLDAITNIVYTHIGPALQLAVLFHTLSREFVSKTRWANVIDHEFQS